MRQKRVTLKDLAAATGVHVSTVSRALNANLSDSLTEEVVARVRQAADRLGYKPNHSAFSLRTNRTMTVGVLIPDIANMIFPPIVRGIESVLEPLGYASLIVNTDNQPPREQALLEQLVARGVDGIIHAGISAETESDWNAQLDGRPIIAVNRRSDSTDIPSVVNDDAGGIRKIFQYLIENGHRRIVHIAGPRSLSTGRARREAFERQSEKSGLPLEDSVVIESSAYTEEEGSSCAELALKNHPNHTAYLCANDRLAIGVLQALARHGLRCPADKSVTGFNDMPLLDVITPGLSTVHVPLFESGQTAGRLLAQMMQDPQIIIPAQTVMPVEIVLRGSIASV
jgi:LacI family transcriptional regulator